MFRAIRCGLALLLDLTILFRGGRCEASGWFFFCFLGLPCVSVASSVGWAFFFLGLFFLFFAGGAALLPVRVKTFAGSEDGAGSAKMAAAAAAMSAARGVCLDGFAFGGAFVGSCLGSDLTIVGGDDDVLDTESAAGTGVGVGVVVGV